MFNFGPMMRRIVDDDLHGEAIIYDKLGTTQRTIQARVKRFSANAQPENDGMTRVTFEVQVEDDATLGISSSELDTGQDFLWIAERFGGAREKWPIQPKPLCAGGRLVLYV